LSDYTFKAYHFLKSSAVLCIKFLRIPFYENQENIAFPGRPFHGGINKFALIWPDYPANAG